MEAASDPKLMTMPRIIQMRAPWGVVKEERVQIGEVQRLALCAGVCLFVRVHWHVTVSDVLCAKA